MAFTVEYTDDGVREWHATEEGVRVERNEAYRPTIYVSADTADRLEELRIRLRARGDVAGMAYERWRTAFRNDPETVLRVDVSRIDRVTPLAGWIRRRERPGTYRLYDVDFSREFRYCLEQGLNPVPERSLRVLELGDPTPGEAEASVRRLEIGDETISGSPEQVLDALCDRLDAVDPDVLVCSSAALVPALFETATGLGQTLALGRRPGYEKLAGASTYESYGQVGHSPARYDVPGRVLIDRSNTFFYHETNLAGCLDLVERSRKPLQELSWASIGNVLTAIQIREARERGVLVPWQSWRHEFPKTMRQLHDGDRGGFTFSPAVGVHEDVHELDFASLYPNIICTRNISPETIRCDCHDRADVPELGYSICDQSGYLPDVLQPIVDDREQIKAALAEADDPEREAALSGRSEALKWILVSCFGYQGFSNAKFGRIECHEAINAVARQILLDAKAALEAAGWRVVHGIVDSLWVTPREGEKQDSLDEVAAAVTDETGIRLEYEGAYDWLAFVPRRDGKAGALTKYFGRRRDGSYKYRGIECRQHSTAPVVADCQRDLIEGFDAVRAPGEGSDARAAERVCDRLAGWIDRLDSGEVDPESLAITQRASKHADEYDRATRTAAAVRRAAAEGLGHAPGREVRYVVVDDDRSDRDRVRLAHEVDGAHKIDSAHEGGNAYDADFYRERLVRAAESVLSPMGWAQEDIERYLGDSRETSLSRFAARE
jgi:DNA polymerase I